MKPEDESIKFKVNNRDVRYPIKLIAISEEEESK